MTMQMEGEIVLNNSFGALFPLSFYRNEPASEPNNRFLVFQRELFVVFQSERTSQKDRGRKVNSSIYIKCLSI